MDCVVEGVARPHPSRDKRTQVLVCGTNKQGDTKFRLPYPVTSVKSCRLVWASVPGVSSTTTAAYVKVGGYAINKVHAAIPIHSSMNPLDFSSGRGHFFVIPNSVETYVPKNETDEVVLFSPELSNVTEVEVELYPLPDTRPRAPPSTPPTPPPGLRGQLMDLGTDTFSMLLEFVSSHR